MQIVIDIPNEMFDWYDNGFPDEDDAEKLWQIVKNGIPLPKGHGDLIDRNKIEYLKTIHDLKWNKITASECATKIKYSAPTIIEADTESEGKDEL